LTSQGVGGLRDGGGGGNGWGPGVGAPAVHQTPPGGGRVPPAPTAGAGPRIGFFFRRGKSGGGGGSPRWGGGFGLVPGILVLDTGPGARRFLGPRLFRNSLVFAVWAGLARPRSPLGSGGPNFLAPKLGWVKSHHRGGDPFGAKGGGAVLPAFTGGPPPFVGLVFSRGKKLRPTPGSNTGHGVFPMAHVPADWAFRAVFGGFRGGDPVSTRAPVSPAGVGLGGAARGRAPQAFSNKTIGVLGTSGQGNVGLFSICLGRPVGFLFLGGGPSPWGQRLFSPKGGGGGRPWKRLKTGINRPGGCKTHAPGGLRFSGQVFTRFVNQDFFTGGRGNVCVGVKKKKTGTRVHVDTRLEGRRGGKVFVASGIPGRALMRLCRRDPLFPIGVWMAKGGGGHRPKGPC